jgi:uncharacterized protein YjbI with pentapeptide repeats
MVSAPERSAMVRASLRTRWGDPISEERQAELQGYLDRWAAETDHGERRGPFDLWEREGQAGEIKIYRLNLTGADIYWLAEKVRAPLRLAGVSVSKIGGHSFFGGGDIDLSIVPDLHLERAALQSAHLEGAHLRGKHLEGAILGHLTKADLSGAYLEGADLSETLLEGTTFNYAHLEKANLSRAYLEHAALSGAFLDGADLSDAHLERAQLHGASLKKANVGRAYLPGVDLSESLLERADLREAHLEGANLSTVDLRSADLSNARLDNAILVGAHLEGTTLVEARLNGANLNNAWMDKTTALNDAALDRTSLDQATFDNTNLSVVDWRLVPVLGDELTAQRGKDSDGKRKPRSQRVEEYQAAARAYRRLAVALQANGLTEEAAGYLYRASIMQRRLAYRERRFGAYFFSVLLAVLAGYGYRLGRIVVAYLSVVLFFAALFLGARYLAGGAIDGPQVADALQISLNAIYGRVFFAQFGLDTLQSWIATIESVVGIVIEGVFVAMLIQRFFGK